MTASPPADSARGVASAPSGADHYRWEPGEGTTPPGTPVIELEGVHRSFGGNEVLHDIHLSFPAGRTTAIIGPSGAGKSVLLKHLVALLLPDRGRVTAFGVDVTRASTRELYAVRRRFGMLFQDGALFDSLTVGENVAFPLEQHGKGLSEQDIRQRAEQKLEWVDLPGFFDRPISSLSGGQRKRVGLARAIVTEPEVVLFDEPNSGLDPITSDAIDDLILNMKRRLGITFIVISHDIVGTVKVADFIGMLYEGRLVEYAPTARFLASPLDVVRRFLKRNLAPPANLPADHPARLPDDPPSPVPETP